MTYRENVAQAINGELFSRLIPRNKQAKRGHKQQRLPNAKHINKLIKYYNRTK